MFYCFVMFFLSFSVGSYAALPSNGCWDDIRLPTVHTAHCTLHTAHCTLKVMFGTVYCTLYTVHGTLHTAQSCPGTVHYLLYTAHCTVMSGHGIPLLCTVQFRDPLVSLWSIIFKKIL